MDDPQTSSRLLKHFIDASKLYEDYIQTNFADVIQSHVENNPELHQPLDAIQPAPENMLPPVDEYLAFYSDLLGFSDEITDSGTDGLPDYYGAAFYSAGRNPAVKVYLLSDSCLAFAPLQEIDSFMNFVSSVYSNWLEDGLLPQCFIGYGTFVERKPFRGKIPANFFGTQVSGSALVDAVNLSKAKTLGSRILVTKRAIKYMPEEQKVFLVKDKDGNFEFLPPRPMQDDLRDCIYHLMWLRDLSPSQRPYMHHIWSLASKGKRSGSFIVSIALNVASSHITKDELTSIANAASEVYHEYQGVR